MKFEPGIKKIRITFETKCRRCDALSEWIVFDKDALTGFKFSEWQVDKMNNATTCHCEKCGKQTVHDTVAFNEKEM